MLSTSAIAANVDLDSLLAYGTATIYEASGIDCALAPNLRPVWPGAVLSGRALPVRTHPADNLPLHLAVEAARPGDVLVVDGREERCGYWGEVLAVAAQQKGVRGLVIDGGVRDVAALAALNFPVFATAVSIRRTGKYWRGIVGRPLTVAGVMVTPGDAVIADADGVVVLPASQIEQVLAASAKRVAKEKEWMDQIRRGAATLSLMNLPTCQQ